LRDAVGMSELTSGHVIRKLRRVAPTLVAAALAIAYLIIAPTGADLPAQLLRVKLFGAEGFGIWNNWWYGGHDVTAYSVLFPPLAWLLTPQLLAALASVGTAAAFEALVHDSFGDDAWLGATWLGAATVTELLSGRLTFAFGLCGAAVTALLLERRRPRSATALAFLTALASPVAALFAALAAAIFTLTAIRRLGGLRRRFSGDVAWGIVAISGAIVPVAVLAVVFPEGGSQPFAFATLWPLLVVGLGVLQLRPGRVISATVVLYLAGCVLAYLLTTPVGSNAARLGELTAGPLVALLLVPRRAWLLLALAAVPLTYIQIHDAITDLQHGEQANSTAFYQPLVHFLETQPGAAAHAWRVEVPFTAGHWESYRLAPLVPLARGWERQLDIADNGLFYGGRLTAGTYGAWLHRLAVHYVAVADTPPDHSARAELRLIRDGLPYLTAVARLPHWTVYAVRDPSQIVSGAGRLSSMGPNSLTLTITRPGGAYVRVRWSPYWRLTGVPGCVVPAGQFTRIEAREAGSARLVMSFSLARVRARAPRCN
jgi:hypothetical protein